MIIYTKKEEFPQKYFKNRWELYLGRVSEYSKKIIEENGMSTFLEIGCAGIPLIKNSDTIDLYKNLK